MVGNTDAAVVSTTADVENQVPMMSAPRRHFTCFLRTKSDGAIGNSISTQMSSVVDVTNKPLTVTFQPFSLTSQDENRVKNEQGIHDIRLRKRILEPVQNNSTQRPLSEHDTDSEVMMTKSVCYEYDRNVEARNFQPKVLKLSMNSDQDSCRKLPPGQQFPAAEVSDCIQPVRAVYWNGNFAGSTYASFANAVSVQEVLNTGHPSGSEISCCTSVPLSTSNIINVNLAGPATTQNSASSRRRVIVLKQRPLTSATVRDQCSII